MLKNSVNSRSRYTIRGSSTQTAAVPMARKHDVPAGTYNSEIVSVKPTKTSAGADAIEVIYRLTNVRGQTLLMREVIPINSYPYRRFCDALIAAGVKEGTDILDVGGVQERIELSYPDPHGLGRIEKRTPLNSSSSSADASDDAKAARYTDDDEFDDFLDDIDNEE